MEALEFLKERKRLCNSYKNCDGCPFVKGLCAISDITSDEERKSVIATVEQWAKEHPRKTRQSVFLKQWATAKIDESGCLNVCPYLVSATHRDEDGRCAIMMQSKCYDCRREFWMQEVE